MGAGPFGAPGGVATVTPMDAVELQPQLEAWAHDTYGAGRRRARRGTDAGPRRPVVRLRRRSVDAGAVAERLVMRMPPKGVRRRGNTDVLRQVPLLAGAAPDRPSRSPEVRWWSDDERWFEVPFFMVGRLPGGTYTVRDPDPGGSTAARRRRRRCSSRRSTRSRPSTCSTGAPSWPAGRSRERSTTRSGSGTRSWPRRPSRSGSRWGSAPATCCSHGCPPIPAVGLFHGDFQTSNVLFDDGRLVAVLDWEISGLGAQLLDLGWLLMMNDPRELARRRGPDDRAAVRRAGRPVQRQCRTGRHRSTRWRGTGPCRATASG